MKKVLFLITISLLSCKGEKNCPKGINLLPMYGEVKKCKQQIDFDKEFILESEKQFGNKTKASNFYVSKAWEYFHKNDNQTSMKRFNQAWLLDKTNPETYWGFGNLLGRKGDYKKSLKYFQKSIEIEPNNPKVYESISTSYGQIFFNTKEMKYLNLTIENLKKSLEIEPNNGKAYAQLANAYSYFMQKDSLRKYIKKTDKINPKLINPEIRKIANQ
jgi:tetratricopeptide (TPR) repeat protein